MHFATVQRTLGLLIILFSATLLAPIGVSLVFTDDTWLAFLSALAVTLATGVLVWWPVRGTSEELRTRDGFLVVAGFWLGLGSLAGTPFFFVDLPVMSLTDAVFEAVSGLTTTGATVLTGLDGLPPSILYYRAQLQWLGGMGVIVLAVAVLPMLGVGGMQLYRAETPGAVKDAKLTPRITGTAKALWGVYVLLTGLCVLAYWLAGMTWFDAICHGLATVSTGGFSTHDASLAWFENPLIEAVAIVFMCLGGMSFALHFMAWRGPRPAVYWADPECRAYLLVLAGLAAFIGLSLWASKVYPGPDSAMRAAVFQVVSCLTSTGFTTAGFALWPGALPVLLIFASFIGGCGGSTAGGMKVIRWLMLYNQGVREVRRLIHPSAEVPVKLGTLAVPARVVEAVWGFFAAYVVLFALMMTVLLATGLDQVTAFSAIATSMNNLGPGLGAVAVDFQDIRDVDKWVCLSAMLLGRLEIFTLLVLASPGFWQR